MDSGEHLDIRIWYARYERLSPLANEDGQFRFNQRLANGCYTREYTRWIANGGAHGLSEAKRILGK